MARASLVVALLSSGILNAVATPSGAEEAVQALTRAYNASGQMLFRDFQSQPGNIVLSPYSIGTAMAMALAGTRGDTEREMAALLQHTLTREGIDAANAAAIAALNGYDRSGAAPDCPAGFKLAGERCEAPARADGSCAFPAKRVDQVCALAPTPQPSARLLVANALMLAGGEVAESYADLLRKRYAAEVFRGANLDTVNGWVRQRTEGKIDKILDRLSDVVLVNAVYFKSRWALAFAPETTKPEPFQLARDRREMVPTMGQRANFAVVTREGYRAIRLPYVVRSLAMVIALPNEIEGVGEVARRIDAAELAQTLAELRKESARPVVLTLPRFKAEFSADLKRAFERLGLVRPFDLNRADFSGLTGMPPAKVSAAIDQIVHRAVIDVSEEATEAAAATAIGIRVTAAAPKPVEPIEFKVDRPFLYYVVDDTTGAVLFQGRLSDPR